MDGTEVVLDRAAAMATAVFASVEDDDFSDDPNVIVYFVRPSCYRSVRAIATLMKKWQVRHPTIVRHRLVCLHTSCHHHPNSSSSSSSAIVERILQEEGVWSRDDVSLHCLSIDLLPLDGDVYSLEDASILHQADIENCPSLHITTVAQSLLKIQDIMAAKIPRIQSLGPLAEATLRKMMDLQHQQQHDDDDNNNPYDHHPDDHDIIHGDPHHSSSHENARPDIAAMILLDRKVDLVTPMLTPLTYEGLLDDVLGIHSGFVTVDQSILEPSTNTDTSTATHTHTTTTTTTTTTSTTSTNPFGDAPIVDKHPRHAHHHNIHNRNNNNLPLPLNDTDTLYAKVRDQHVEKFGSFLQEQAKALKQSHSNFTDNKQHKNLSDIHQFVKQIPIFTQNLRSLTNHIHLAELIKQQTTSQQEFRQRWQTERSMMESESCYDTLEDLISSQEPPYRLLRLLCLQSLTSGGIKSSRYDSLRREVVQTYGYEYLFALLNFEKLGLLKRRETLWMDSASPFASLRKMLKLIHAEVNTVEPDDVAYVSSGYAPISIRLIQAATQGWSGKEDLLKELPGRLLDIQQQQANVVEDFATLLRPNNKPTIHLGTLAKSYAGGEKKPILLVYFIGGVTFMEIAALRFLSKRSNFPYQIICCTTKIMNGTTFLQSLS